MSTSPALAPKSRQYSYERRRPEHTTLHRVVRENLLTLYAAVEQGFASPLGHWYQMVRRQRNADRLFRGEEV